MTYKDRRSVYGCFAFKQIGEDALPVEFGESILNGRVGFDEGVGAIV